MRRRDLLGALIGGVTSLTTRPLDAAGVTLRDAAGRRVDIPNPPRRIVTIFASNTEIVSALGLVDRIVGIDALTTFPAATATIPKVSGRLGLSVEAVVEQRPDLVLVTPSRGAMHQILDPMTRLGIPVLVLMSRSVNEVVSNVRLVGDACHERGRGEALASALERRLSAVAARTPAARPRVAMITGRVGTGLLLVAQPKTYTGDAIVLAGGRHALGAAVGGQVSPEALWTADPDVLLYAGQPADFDHLLRESDWRGLRAIREGHAHAVFRSYFTIPGPRTIDGIEQLSTRLSAFQSRS